MKLGVLDFFEDIKNFFTYRRVLGVDIGTSSIKLVEAARVADLVMLENYGVIETKEYLERGNAAIQTSSLKINEGDAVRYLKILLNEVRPKAKRVVASVPAFSSFVVPLEIPLLSPLETAKAVPYQAKQVIPISIAEAKLDWFKVDEFESKKGVRYQRLIVVVVPDAIIKKYRSIFHAVGLRLVALEVESLALGRALISENDPPLLVVDIGALSTSMAVFERGVLKQVGQTDYGSAALSQALSRSLGISVTRAEELKRRRGLLGTGGEYELSTSLLPFLDVIIQECERVRGNYEHSYNRKVEKLVLVGAGAKLPGVHDYFGREMRLEVRAPMVFRQFRYPPQLEPAAKSLESELALVAGLALKFYK